MAAVSTQNPVNSLKRTMRAQAASQGRGLAVVQGGSGDIYAATNASAGAPCLGIQEEPSTNAGDPISVVMDGEAIAIAGGAVNAGQYVKSDATGKLVATSTTGDHVLGVALSSAAASGDEFLLLIRPFTY